jgi:hypothetical protein
MRGGMPDLYLCPGIPPGAGWGREADGQRIWCPGFPGQLSQHPEGPVDGLAGDRLAVAQELADLLHRPPGRAEILSGLHLPGCQPALTPAVPAAGRGGGQAILGVLAD